MKMGEADWERRNDVERYWKWDLTYLQDSLKFSQLCPELILANSLGYTVSI